MPTLEKTQAKVIKTRVKAQDDLDSARTHAERKIARVQATLARIEEKINVRIERALEKADAELKRGDGEHRIRNVTAR